MKVHAIADATTDAFLRLGFGSELDRDLVADQAPDLSWVVIDEGGQTTGRCSVWWKATPAYAEHRVGVVGHYAAATGEAAATLLATAKSTLREKDCTLAIGPMDRNTWYRYRLVTERGDEPLFFLEPDNPGDWPAHFLEAGFTSIAQYTSAVRTEFADEHGALEDLSERARQRGITLRSIDPGDFEAELDRLYELSIVSFRENLFYAAIGREAFNRLYRGIESVLRPELVLFAERNESTVGFVFAIPDFLQAQRGLAIDTAILKTLAVHPDESGWGLGTLLAESCHQAAGQMGFRRMIHALMQADNRSRRISDHAAKTIRRYDLFGVAL